MKNRLRSLLETTTNLSVYNKLIKLDREMKGNIGCSWCPYHKYENDNGSWEKKNWKNYRKTQYRVATSKRKMAKQQGQVVKPKNCRWPTWVEIGRLLFEKLNMRG